MSVRTQSRPKLKKARQRLVEDALGRLERSGYDQKTQSRYARIWRSLLRFTADLPLRRALSPPLIRQYLASRGIPDPYSTSLRSYEAVVRRAVRIFVEITKHGCFRSRMRMKPSPALPGSLGRELPGYELFCKEHLKHRPRTVYNHRKSVLRFLKFLESQGISSLQAVRPKVLTDFLCSQVGLRPSSLAVMVGHVRAFLRYLFMRGLLKEKVVVPRVKTRFPLGFHARPVWPEEAVESLLRSVDRSSPVGKRDYAILVLACRLGLRGSDIRSLRLEDIRWEEARITVTQSKTSRRLTLPLENEVGEALVDYLRHGRPATDYREVFLRVRAPIEPMGRLGPAHVVRFHLQRAGISLPPGSQRGVHALRHALAVRLLKAGEPLETIAGVLGHISIETTRGYTRLDVQSLRSVAMDPDEVLRA